MAKPTVRIIIVTVFIAVLGFDAYLYSDNIPGNSISQVIIEASDKSKLVPAFVGFLFGFLTSHFFDNYTEPR